MAKQKSYSDDKGNSYNDSYWNVQLVLLYPNKRQAHLAFQGFKNLTARNNNKEPVAVERFIVNGTDYDDYFAISKIEGVGKNVVKACYLYAVEKTTIFEGASDV